MAAHALSSSHEPRRTLSIVPLTAKQKTALKADYVNGALHTEMMQNLVKHPVVAYSLAFICAPNFSAPHFHYAGKRRYRVALVTDGESFGLIFQNATRPGSPDGMVYSPMELITASALPFAPVAQEPSDDAILRLHAAHCNWLFSQQAGLPPSITARTLAVARDMLEQSDTGPTDAVLFFEEGAAAETIFRIPLLPASAEQMAHSTTPATSIESAPPLGAMPIAATASPAKPSSKKSARKGP